MKKLLIIILSSVLIFSCNSDTERSAKSGFDTIKTLHEKDNGNLSFSMPAFLFKMFVKSEDKNIKDAVSKINDINFFIQETVNEDFTDDLNKHILNKNYTDLLTVNDNDVDVKVVANEKNDKISEVIVVINAKEKNSYVLLRIGGEFDNKSVKSLIEGIDIEKVSKYR